MRINSSEITVVLQGAVQQEPQPYTDGLPLTQFCISAFRKFLPDAEIILSTWEGDYSDFQDVDKVILNTDPGSLPPQENSANKFININRQIVSTLSGVQNAERPWVLKTRSDTTIIDLGFLTFFEKYAQKHQNTDIFDYDVLVPSYNTRGWKFPVLYHISDMFHFGSRADILKIWSLPLASKEDALWFIQPQNQYPKILNPVTAFKGAHFPQRFTPEQFIQMNLLGYGKINKLNHLWDFSWEHFRNSESFLRDNYLLWPADCNQLLQPDRIRIYNQPNSPSFRSDWKELRQYRSSPQSADAWTLRNYLLSNLSRVILFGRSMIQQMLPTNLFNRLKTVRFNQRKRSLEQKFRG